MIKMNQNYRVWFIFDVVDYCALVAEERLTRRSLNLSPERASSHVKVSPPTVTEPPVLLPHSMS